MYYIFTTLASIVAAVLAFILKTVIRENRDLKHKQEQVNREREKALENGVVCLLRVKLIEYHAKYMELGDISSHAYENWRLMYLAYKTLGGNGLIEHMNDEIEELHIRVNKKEC